jgi:hypothetical protein
MNCKRISENIPAIIKREIKSEDRILYIDHIKLCSRCRDDYQKYLKLFYTLELNAVQPEEELAGIPMTMPDLTQGVPFKFRWPLAIAASFLAIVVSMLILVNLKSDRSVILSDRGLNIREQLVEEDWTGLSKIINNQDALAETADQTIPVNLLLDKLKQLEQKGITKISVAVHKPNTGIKEIEMQYFIDQLQQYRKYKSALSVREISDFIYLI